MYINVVLLFTLLTQSHCLIFLFMYLGNRFNQVIIYLKVLKS